MSESSLLSLLLVMMIAALAPIVSRLIPGRPPQVLFLIIGGVVIGPHVLGVADSDDIQLVAGLGLGFLVVPLGVAAGLIVAAIFHVGLYLVRRRLKPSKGFSSLPGRGHTSGSNNH